jgi:hypothetical protein
MLKTKQDHSDPGPSGMCPDCFYEVRTYASQAGSLWKLTRMCNCKKIKYDLAWPFTTGPSVHEVNKSELADYPGIWVSA